MGTARSAWYAVRWSGEPGTPPAARPARSVRLVGRHRRPVGVPGSRTVRVRRGDRPGTCGSVRIAVESRGSSPGPRRPQHDAGQRLPGVQRRYVARRGQTQTGPAVAAPPGRSPARPRPRGHHVGARPGHPGGPDGPRAPPGDDRRRGRSSRPPPWCCATSARGSGRTSPSARRGGPSSSSGSTTSRRPWPSNAVRDQGLLALLGEDAVVSDEARALEREMLRRAGIEPAPVEAPPGRGDRGRARQARRGAAVGRLAPDGQPVPRPRLLGRPAERLPSDAAGELGAPRPAAALVRARRQRGLRRAWTCPSRPRGACPAAASSCRTRPGWSPRPPRATGPSCSPTSRGWARRPRRCSPPRPPRPTRCSSSCPTSSRRTGCVRPGCGPRGARPPRSTATATRSTASPTSSSSTTRCSTGTWAGSASSASAGWSSTRRTSSRTRPRSARSTCWGSPSASGPSPRARCSWPSPARR